MSRRPPRYGRRQGMWKPPEDRRKLTIHVTGCGSNKYTPEQNVVVASWYEKEDFAIEGLKIKPPGVWIERDKLEELTIYTPASLANYKHVDITPPEKILCLGIVDLYFHPDGGFPPTVCFETTLNGELAFIPMSSRFMTQYRYAKISEQKI